MSSVLPYGHDLIDLHQISRLQTVHKARDEFLIYITYNEGESRKHLLVLFDECSRLPKENAVMEQLESGKHILANGLDFIWCQATDCAKVTVLLFWFLCL